MQPESADQASAAIKVFLGSTDTPCPRCGYNLRGAACVACPECGSELRLTLVPEHNITAARWALRLLCGWMIAAGVIPALQLLNVLREWASGGLRIQIPPWWWLATAWPAAVCLAGAFMLIGLLSAGRGMQSRTTQRRWLVAFTILLGLQAIASGVLAARWGWTRLGF